MKWIDAGDIKNWVIGKQRHCQATLPELVRRLILAHTAGNIDEFNFPSGDSVSTSGWDGRLKTSVVSPFFPRGASGWEIGTDKSAHAKAEADYIKRTADPMGFTVADTTFVFVTPRLWPGRIKWQGEKRETGTWKDVRVINADILEQWLESAPAVALWLARQIDKVISDDIRDLEAVWEEWSVGTNPTMTPALVIGGRTRDLEVIQKWIADKPSILEVQADDPDEALALLYASISTLPETEKRQALARCVVVQHISELRQLTQAFQNYPLIIAGSGECIRAAPAAVAKGHHIFISMDSTVIGIRDILRLSRPQRGEVEKILRESGLSDTQAQQIARDSGRSIPVLRRHLFQSRAVSAPQWATAESAKKLLGVLFANAWDENAEGDRQVVGTLSGMSYDIFVRELTPFLSMEDSPIRKVGNVWILKSPLDAWFLLAPHVTQNHLRLFAQSLLAVLTKTDPKYELEAEKRWAAAMYGKSNPYSEWLRTGLVESLVLLAVFGNRSANVASTQAFADSVVREILITADKWEAWASIKDATALLAEAAPSSFMDAIEKWVAENPTVFRDLMKDDPGIFSECRHSGLLWALEGIAWSPEYLTRATNILLELASIDPGDRWANRPINSLADIFLPGFPQTHAKPKDRLEALESLIDKNPRIVWRFTQKYFGDGSISESHRFRWRDTGGTRRGLDQEKNREYQEYQIGLSPILRDLACKRENLVDSVDGFIRFPVDMRKKLLATLEAMNPNDLSKEERDLLLQAVRAALNWINSYGENDQLAHVPTLNRILKIFAPADVLERVGWLLSTPWPRLPEGQPKDYKAIETTIEKAQKDAAREVLNNASIARIIEFAATIQYQGVLGHSLARAVRDKTEDSALLDAFSVHATDMPMLLRWYSRGRVEVNGHGWIAAQIESMKARGNYSAEACALLYFGLPEGSDTWSVVNAHGKDVETAYWRQASGRSQTDKVKDAPIAVEKLLDAMRPEAALEIAGESGVSVSSILLQRLLQELLTLEEKKFRDGAMDLYYLGHVFNQLYERNEFSIEEIAKLEWPFAALFEELKRYTSTPMALHRILKKDPQFFSLLISFIYKRDDHTADPTLVDITDEMAERRAHVAYQVLRSWRMMPGIEDDGTLDEKELTDWVEAARRQCAETKHVRGCDRQIGSVLARAPSDNDGIWPHVAVRNLIEHLNNEMIDRHIQNEIYNSRGVVSRGPDDGGKRERELADKYEKMSDALKNKWPRTSAILRGIADSYRYQAKREDIETELWDLRWD
jgi:hypothetical protein